ncbi:type III restriction enzyme [Megasphaera paucivorans]|uniref:Type III restriction enzyme n=1 Tax=Megasphaera paucivorans TaxID=349095 RepID=A0A1G9QXH6_9FIRM|nr:type III restriction-modification system endonuclease [Megasphaera paucivorans]SDM15736.1 type III restriction enzyme [Megasphaera paucivorans]
MELILERQLEHQQKAVDAITSALDGITMIKPHFAYENPLFDREEQCLIHNLEEVQKNIRTDYCGCRDEGNYLNLDIKMETGTGKTYVYTQTIYEMHKKFGFNKFIIAVPSLPIKEGTAQFIGDSYVKHHFSDTCGYNCDIELGVLESPKKKKKGFLAMPPAVCDYVTGSCQNSNKIYVLLVNMQLLTNSNILTRSDYDYLVEGFYRPFNALKATKPIVIIDEPHRFARDQRAYKAIVEELCPQLIIRYGATFPDTTVGKGRNKATFKDFNNLVYELNACDSFNHNLIKGVAKEHFEPLSQKEEKVKLLSVESKTSATFQFKRRGEDTKTYILTSGDSLSIIDAAFEGITISAIGKNFIELTNGQIKYKSEEFNTDIYSSSYQEQMLKLAIERHFKTERQNFSGRQFKIKTLALFFIDDISSYRDSDDEKKPYLKEMFERLLLEKINDLISKLTNNEQEYRDYLEASKADIAACHAGYFAQDNSDSDEAIASEVADILHNKKELISLRREDGSFNTRRFLFSKWTLKEGWDNPNVFTIAKLRSSGSENSKLQEVGRGLRLPVDENGNRISNEEFKLNYIVDFTEADFAQKLVDEINGELPEKLTISEERLKEVAEQRKIDYNTLFFELGAKGYINMNKEIIPDKRDAFYADYPEFASGVSSNKVTDVNKNKKGEIHVRKAVYTELKTLWENINHKYYLFFDRDLTNAIPQLLHDILRKNDIFGNVTLYSHRDEVVNDGKAMMIRKNSGVSYSIKRPIPYNEFLKRISQQTSIPILEIHAAMCELAKEKENGIPEEFINEYSVANIVSAFSDWRIEQLQTRFKYSRSNQPVTETALTYKNGTPREIIKQGNVGTMFVEGTPSDKYLYDKIAFDSPLEKDNIMTDISEVVVYGKIPRSSIAIPTIVGENYSPDFMYVVKKTDGTKELNIVVETKLVKNNATLRDTEKVKIKCAEKFFNQLTLDGYKVSFHTQLENKKVKQIIQEVIAE